MIPRAPQRPHALLAHDDLRQDPWYWLRDDERNNPEVINYLTQENAWAEKALAGQQTLRATVLQELISRIPAQDDTVPYENNRYRYRQRYETGQEYPILQRQALDQESWQTLLDGNIQAKGYEWYSMGRVAVSPDNQLLAVTEDFVSRRQYQIRVRQIADGLWFDELIDNVEPALEWSADSQGFWYIGKNPQTLQPWQVWYHRLGTPRSQDRLVYQENDDRFYVELYTTTSRDFVCIALSSSTTSEIQLLDAHQPERAVQCLLARRQDHEYNADHLDGTFFIRSNREGKTFGLYQSPQALSGNEQHWHCLIVPDPAVMLESVSLFSRWLVTEEREGGATRLRYIDRVTDHSQQVVFDDPAYMTWVGVNAEPQTDWLRYVYTSLTAPVTVFELNMASGERRMLKQVAVPGFDPSAYQSERLWLAGADGVKVPVSLVYRKSLFHSGENPLLVYGYGSYGASIDAEFDAERLSLLDRGFVFAIAHVRGGGELGQQWYEDGKLLTKGHTFSDYLMVCRKLLAQGYGDPKKLYAMGASAGGLLMGVAINEAPDLFHGVIAQVPFVDALTTMLDDSIPLTTREYEEWGNPQNRVYYDYIKAYSPYDNVKAQAYPHLLVTSGLHDSQVQYWEPAKWVAKLREMKTDDHQLLLVTDMTAGHGGKSGRYKACADAALQYSFLIALSEE